MIETTAAGQPEGREDASKRQHRELTPSLCQKTIKYEAQKHLLSQEPENLADFISSHHDAQRITVTDIADRPLLDVGGGFINGSPGPGIRTKIINRLAKIQAGEMTAGEVLQLDRSKSDAYFAAEDRAVTMAEYGMECGMG